MASEENRASLVGQKDHTRSGGVMLGVVFVAWLIAGAVAEAGTVAYSFIDLTPTGSTGAAAFAISGTQIAGDVNDGAFLWNGSGGTVNLTPGSYSYSYATDGKQQVGRGYPSGDEHALLWAGTASSMVDLHPNGWAVSVATAVGDGWQAGYGSPNINSTTSHALLWTGTAPSYVDLHPAQFKQSVVWGGSGNYQVGAGEGGTAGQGSHALLWSGSAASVIDLNAPGLIGSSAFAVSGDQVVGEGGTANGGGAMIFTGLGQGFILLNPLGFTSSRADGTNGSQQVGFGSGASTGNNNHALLWNGSATDFVDLHTYLPSGFVTSYAFGINADGDVVGEGTDAAGNMHAIEWAVNPVPLPSTVSTGLTLLLGTGVIIIVRRKLLPHKTNQDA